MKKLLLICLGLCFAGEISAAGQEIEKLREGFLTPPPGGRAQTWWHWTSEFVTKPGITADLEAMKGIGYEGLHLFATSSSPKPEGVYHEMLTPEWMELLKYAGEEAQRLGLTIGVHNCPGWSLSGGPWMTPENAMQMIVSSEVNVSGGKKGVKSGSGSGTGFTNGKIVLPQPETRYDFYRDISVLAFPDVNRHDVPKVTTDFPEDSIQNIIDFDYDSYIRLPIREEGTQAIITFEYDEPLSPQFIEMTFGEIHLFVKGTIEASADGVNYKTAAEYDYKIRTDLRLPKYIRLDENAENARFFRVTYQFRPYRAWMKPQNVMLREVRFLASSMVSEVDSRNAMEEDNFSYKPFPEDYTTPGISPGQMLDLTDKLRPDGTLDWDVPAGNWTILRIGHTTTGKHNGPNRYSGLECDKLNRRGLTAHWPHMMTKIEDLLAPTGTLKYAIIDSYEAGGQNWTEGFHEEFRKPRGYDMMPYLPAVIGWVVGTPQESAKFLYDFSRTISDLFAENYYDYFTELCHRDGLMSITEAYFGPFDYLRCARMADVPTGEFWVGPPGSTLVTDVAASAGHFHGKNRIATESFTTDNKPGRWQQDPKAFKEFGDRAWIRGISQLVSHSFVHQPFVNVRPGFTLGHNGAHINRQNTWWDYGHGWVEYMNRSQFLLQSGIPVADVLILSGESKPNNFYRPEALTGNGYNFDFCCADDIIDFVKVVDGRIVAPSGIAYSCLSLGTDWYLTSRTLKKVYELLEQGATVVGIPPIHTPSLTDDETEWKALRDQIWGSCAYGEITTVANGRVAHSLMYETMLPALGIGPDVVLPKGVNGIHRQTGDVDIYFIFNDTQDYITSDVKFRILGKSPELWYADEKAMQPAAVWRTEDNYTVMPLTLVPNESVFVLFKPGEQPHILNLDTPMQADGKAPMVKAFVENGDVRFLFNEAAAANYLTTDGQRHSVMSEAQAMPQDISTDWTVHFAPELGAPESIDLAKLASLSEYPEDAVKYFSGTARYTKVFRMDKITAEDRIVLDLGTVKNLAEVYVNGKKVALLWKEPFQTDITPYVKAGNNKLEIDVTNLWVNRLIGDARNPNTAPETDGWPNWVLEDKPNSGEGHYTFSSWKGWSADEDLQPSGLIGPVTLQFKIVK